MMGDQEVLDTFKFWIPRRLTQVSGTPTVGFSRARLTIMQEERDELIDKWRYSDEESEESD